MPWQVYREKGKFCVHKKNPDNSKGELVHCHASAEMARRQQAALYVSENKEVTPEDAIIIDEDNEGTEYKEYYESPGAYASNAHSFDELEGEREARERVSELSSLMSDFNNLAGNIVYSPFEGEVSTDKMQELDKLYSEFKTRASDLLKEPLKKESFIEMAIRKVKEALSPSSPQEEQPSTMNDMMVYKEADGSYGWIASYSNKFKDRDKPPDVIASKAHKEFVESVDKGEAPLPDLLLWHVKEWKIGYATAMAYDDAGFPIAIGRFDDNKECQEVAEWLSKQTDFGVSHGMYNRTIARDPDDPEVIIAYRTHEISPLPKEKAANLLADWYVINSDIKELEEEVNMTIPEEKRQELLKRGLPESTLSALEERNKHKAETATAEGVKSKESGEEVNVPEPETATQPVPVGTAEVPAATETTPAPEGTTAPVTEENKDEETKSSEFPTRQEVAEAVANVLTPKLDEFAKQMELLSNSYKELETKIQEIQTSDEKRIKEIIAMTPRDSLASLMAARLTDRASLSKQTKIGEKDSLLEKKPREEEAKETEEQGHIGIKFIDTMLKDGK